MNDDEFKNKSNINRIKWKNLKKNAFCLAKGSTLGVVMYGLYASLYNIFLKSDHNNIDDNNNNNIVVTMTNNKNDYDLFTTTTTATNHNNNDFQFIKLLLFSIAIIIIIITIIILFGVRNNF